MARGRRRCERRIERLEIDGDPRESGEEHHFGGVEKTGDERYLIPMPFHKAAPEPRPLWYFFEIRAPGWSNAWFDGHAKIGEKKVWVAELMEPGEIENKVFPKNVPSLEPGEEISGLVDLGTIFEGVEDKAIKSIEVFFSFKAKGPENHFWNGSVKSKSVRLRRR